MSKQVPEFVSLDRASRILAPISDSAGLSAFESASRTLLHLCGTKSIRVQATSSCEEPPFKIDADPLTREWFDSIISKRSGSDYHTIAEWNRKFLDWSRKSLLVNRNDVIENIENPSGSWHQPVEHANAMGVSWSLPQALAWVATREPIEVARIQFMDHWSREPSGETAWRQRLGNNPMMRKELIGWLVLITSLNHCKCGSQATANQEAWEVCSCVGSAWDQLNSFANDKRLVIPSYRPEAQFGSFQLEWSDEAAGIQFVRSELVAKWRSTPQTSGRAGAQPACETWLDDQFARDPENDTPKSTYREQALGCISGLSKNAFDRAWANKASEERRRGGAKKKSPRPNQFGK